MQLLKWLASAGGLPGVKAAHRAVCWAPDQLCMHACLAPSLKPMPRLRPICLALQVSCWPPPSLCINGVPTGAYLFHAWRLPCPAGQPSRMAVKRNLSMHGRRSNTSRLCLQSDRQARGGPGSWRLDRPDAGRHAGRPAMGGPIQATQGAPAVPPEPGCNAAAAPWNDGNGLCTGRAMTTVCRDEHCNHRRRAFKVESWWCNCSCNHRKTSLG